MHDPIGMVAQIDEIAAKGIVLPEVLGEPNATHRPTGPHRIALAIGADLTGMAPEVAVVMGDPAATAIVGRGSDRTVDAELLDESQQGLMALRQVGRFGGPVVHLGAEFPSM